MPVKNLKKLVTKEHPTGEDLGRLMIADLVVAYKNARDGKRNTGLINQKDRMNLMARLHGQRERRIYNDYVGIYELVKIYGSICQAMATSVEMQFWRVYTIVATMIQAEANYSFTSSDPVIMTGKEFAQRRDTFAHYPGGVAVLQDIPPCPREKIDSRGWFVRDDARMRFLRSNMAEAVLEEHGESIQMALKALWVAAKAYYRHAVSLELIGQTINVPITEPLIYPFPEKNIAILNKTMLDALVIAERFEIEDPGERERYEDDLKIRLSQLLAPVDLDAAKPCEEAVEKLRKKLSPARLREIKLAEELSRRQPC